MWKKSGKTESFSEPLRAGRIRVRETARRAPLGLAGLLALFCGAGAVLLLADAAFNLLVFDCGTALLFAAGTSVLVWATRLQNGGASDDSGHRAGLQRVGGRRARFDREHAAQ